MSVKSIFFGFRGRINRKQFWVGLLLYMIASIVAIVAGVFGVLALKPGISQNEAVEAFNQVFAAWNCASLIPIASIYVRRLRDRGRSGWWLLIPFLPSALLVSLWPALSASGIVPHGSNPWIMVPFFPFFGPLVLFGLLPPLVDLFGAKLLVVVVVSFFALINLWILVELLFLKGRRISNAPDLPSTGRVDKQKPSIADNTIPAR
jgi:uncharacterized membrane protein YhaH (DUF805 family)